MHVFFAGFWFMSIYMPLFMTGMTVNINATGIYCCLMMAHVIVPLCFLKKKPEGYFFRMRLLYALHVISSATLVGIFGYTLMMAQNPPPYHDFVYRNTVCLLIAGGLLVVWTAFLLFSKTLTPAQLKGCLS